MLDQVAKRLVIVQPQPRAVGDGRRPFAAQAVLAMTAGAADIEPGASGFHQIGRRIGGLCLARIQDEQCESRGQPRAAQADPSFHKPPPLFSHRILAAGGALT